MAKPDWDELQQRFLSDHASTGITRIEDPLAKMRALKGCTWVRKDTGSFGIGFIAQDVEQIFPDAVTISGMPLLMADGSEVKDVRCPDPTGVAAALP